jgi:nitroreductase
MVPRKPVFAESYILATVENFHSCLSNEVLAEAEHHWARDVLEQYFSVVELTPSIIKAKDVFSVLIDNDDVVTKDKRVPFQHQALDPSDVDFKAFRALCEKRHSVRWFKSKPVPREIIDNAIAVAVTAPSACNRQPFQFFVFDDPAQASQIGAIPMGTAGFSENFQCVIVVVADLSAYPFEKDRHIIYIDSALASMQFILAVETQGLNSCAINWPDIERHEREMSKRLELEPYQRPVMLIAVGYADEKGLVPFSEKRVLKDTVRRTQ